MADTNFRGPVNSMGALEAQYATSVATIEPLDGPSTSYQGYCYADPRSFPFQKDGNRPGRVAGFAVVDSFVTMDAIPQAANGSALAAAQVVTAAAPMGLATVGVTNFSANACSIAVGVPIVPQGTTSIVNVIALDFGFTTGTTVANSSTVNVPDNTLFQIGGWYLFGNCGNTGATASLIAQVISASANGTTLQISPTPATALGVPIGGTNLFGSGLLPPASQFGPAAASASSAQKVIAAGLAKVHNPRELLSRNLSVTANTATGGTAAVLCSGYDVWNLPMTELITASGTTTIYGKKGFKYVTSIVPVQTQAASYTIGIGDTFSFPVRADYVQQLQMWAGNTTINSSVGFTAAVTTLASNTTGDVRGTVQLSGLGAGTPITSQATTNNVLRLYVSQSPTVFTLTQTTPNFLTPMFGTTQSTT